MSKSAVLCLILPYLPSFYSFFSLPPLSLSVIPVFLFFLPLLLPFFHTLSPSHLRLVVLLDRSSLDDILASSDVDGRVIVSNVHHAQCQQRPPTPQVQQQSLPKESAQSMGHQSSPTNDLLSERGALFWTGVRENSCVYMRFILCA